MRRAGPAKGSRRGLLRAVRLALGIPVSEITGRLGVGRTAVFDLETREMRQTATVGSMARMARAMGCKLVYGIVPENGKTLEWLAEERLWRAVLGGESTE
jgi:transcriptional regulator with XRE-family HTH domain